MPLSNTKTPKFLAATIALTGVPASVGVMCLSPVLPAIEASYAGNPDMQILVKYISVGVGLGMILGAPIAGAVSDRVGRRLTLIIALLVFCLFGTAGLLVDYVPALIAMRMIVGAAASACLTVGVALMGELFSDARRDGLIGMNAMCSGIFGIVAILLSGQLGAISVKLPFVLHLLPLPLLLMTILFIPNVKPQARQAVATGQKLNREHWKMIFFSLLCGVVLFSMPVYIPFFMRDDGIANPVENSFVLVTMSVFAAIVASAYGPARARLTISNAFVASMIAFVLGCFGLLVAGSLAGFLGAAVFMGLSAAWIAPNLMSAASILAGQENRGRVVGLIKGANLSGSFVSVILIEPIYRAGGRDAAVGALLALAAFLIAFSLLSIRKIGSAPGGR